MEDKLERDCRIKWLEVDHAKKTVEWVTQQSSDSQSQEAAYDIADAMRAAGYTGWEVRVIIRDKWQESGTKWKIAKTDDVDNDLKEILHKVEEKLDKDCRIKSLSINHARKTVEWVTQQSSDRQSQEAANKIADAIEADGFSGWTVKVVVRDKWKETGPGTPWATAKVD